MFSQIVVTGLACLALVALVSGQNCPNGEPYFPNAGTVDELGCTVGYCSKVSSEKNKDFWSDITKTKLKNLSEYVSDR